MCPTVIDIKILIFRWTEGPYMYANTLFMICFATKCSKRKICLQAVTAISRSAHTYIAHISRSAHMDTHSDGMYLPRGMHSHDEEEEDLDDPALAAEMQVCADFNSSKSSDFRLHHSLSVRQSDVQAFQLLPCALMYPAARSDLECILEKHDIGML